MQFQLKWNDEDDSVQQYLRKAILRNYLQNTRHWLILPKKNSNKKEEVLVICKKRSS